MIRFVFLLLSFFTIGCMNQAPLEEDFEDTAGKTKSAASYLENKSGLVILFLTPECPLCINYTAAMRKLEKEYTARDISFVGIISGEFYTKEEVRRYKSKYKLEMDILFDTRFLLSKYYGATTTPEAVFIDHTGKLKYRGAIDNWAISLGKKRLNTTEHYLSDALDNYLLGNKIDPEKTKPVGCRIE